MRVNEIKRGVSVRFTADAGLEVEKAYVIHSVDLLSHTVRLEQVRGSYSIDHIEGLQIADAQSGTATIPASEAGFLGDAVIAGIPRNLPKQDAPKDGGDVDSIELPVLDPLEGMPTVALLDTLELHLHKLAEHPDPVVKYHARSALRIQWHLEAGGGTEKENSAIEDGDD